MISIKMNLFSNTLSMPMDVWVLLPDYIKEGEHLKVLWLCHGGSGDENEWLYESNVTALPDERHIAIVLVNACDSCFTDMAYGMNYMTYIGNELPETLCTMFKHLSGNREDNLISGLSNGGYGCMLIGLSFPERYAAIGAFSAGDKADANYVPQNNNEMTPRIRMFGKEDIRNTDYSIRYLVKQVSGNETVKPRIYHACGSEDPWLNLNLLVKETMEQLNDPSIDYVYHQMDGMGHEWTFWNQEIRNFLDYAGIKADNVAS